MRASKPCIALLVATQCPAMMRNRTGTQLESWTNKDGW
jgi:hypothetical protein